MASYSSSMATASNRKLFGICSHFCTHTHNACLDNIHLHTAVSHGHGVISQGVTGNLAVIRAADRSERAWMAGVEWVSSLVWPEKFPTKIRLIWINIQQVGNIHCVSVILRRWHQNKLHLLMFQRTITIASLICSQQQRMDVTEQSEAWENFSFLLIAS